MGGDDWSRSLARISVAMPTGAMRLLAGWFAFAASPGFAFLCSDVTDCESCINKEGAFTYACFWCPVDESCHDNGSQATDCTDDNCIAKSAISTCHSSSCGQLRERGRSDEIGPKASGYWQNQQRNFTSQETHKDDVLV